MNVSELPRCPKCGYTKEDASIHLDHYLCSGSIPDDPINPVASDGLVEEKRFYIENFEGIINVRDRESKIRPIVCGNLIEAGFIENDLNLTFNPTPATELVKKLRKALKATPEYFDISHSGHEESIPLHLMVTSYPTKAERVILDFEKLLRECLSALQDKSDG